jgi:hypothetical protein
MKLLGLFVGLILVASAAMSQTPPTAQLSWTAVTTYADGTAIPSGVAVTYNVYQGPTATSLTKVASGVTALTSTITTGLSDGQTYFWSVTAVAGGLEGAQSNVGTKSFAAVQPGTVTLTVK